jgi:hypothetical protein
MLISLQNCLLWPPLQPVSDLIHLTRIGFCSCLVAGGGGGVVAVGVASLLSRASKHA